VLLETPIGGHATVAGGLAKAGLPYLDRSGSAAVQVYVSNPRGWALAAGDPLQDEAFASGCAERRTVAYVHASLLVNLGSPTPLTVERSVATLEHALGRAAAAGLPKLLVEPSAGGGRSLAARVEDLGPYLAAVERHPWLGVCFDTCHAWAAGHDLSAPGGMAATLDALTATVGADRLWLVHANDSKDTVGSTRDRHESVGRGTIGPAAFAELLAHPAAQGVPVIVETPNDDGAGHSADIALLRSLIPERSSSGRR